MRHLLLALAAALALASSAASAQTASAPPGPSPRPIAPVPTWSHVARVNLGIGLYDSGWYNCHYYPSWYPTCTAGGYTDYVPFVVGPQVDLHLDGPSHLSVGFTVAMGSITQSYTSACPGGSCTLHETSSVTMWEPTVDYVAKLAPPTQDTVGRFRAGLALYVVPGSTLGGAVRLGAGASFLASSRVGFGVDLVLEGGVINGQWIGGLQLLASPELRF